MICSGDQRSSCNEVSDFLHEQTLNIHTNKETLMQAGFVDNMAESRKTPPTYEEHMQRSRSSSGETQISEHSDQSSSMLGDIMECIGSDNQLFSTG